MVKILQELPRQKLREVIEKRERTLWEDPLRLKGLLMDLCGEECRREINALITVLNEEHIIDALSALSSTGVSYAHRRRMMAERIYDKTGLADDVALWAVDSWALGLRVITDSQLAGLPKSLDQEGYQSPEKDPTVYPPTSPPVAASPISQRRLGVPITVGILVLLILASIVGGVTIHQNQVNAQATVDAQSVAGQSTADAQASSTAQVIANNSCPSYVQECGSFSLKLLNSLRGSGNWRAGSNSSFGGNCQYNNNAFQVNQTKSFSLYICSEPQSFSNFVFEVQMSFIQGDCGGIVIRDDPNTGRDYVFVICPNTSNTSFRYALFKYTGFRGADSTTLARGNNESIASSGTNTLVVAAINGSITLYVNRQNIASVSDNSFFNGVIGLIADDYAASTSVTYTNARVWG